MQHRRATATLMLQNGISRNTECDIMVGFPKSSHICTKIAQCHFVCYFSLVLHSQTTIWCKVFIACSISAYVERVWYTSYTFFVLAAHPHHGVLLGSCGILNHNSAFNLVHNPVVSHTGV